MIIANVDAEMMPPGWELRPGETPRIGMRKLLSHAHIDSKRFFGANAFPALLCVKALHLLLKTVLETALTSVDLVDN